MTQATASAPAMWKSHSSFFLIKSLNSSQLSAFPLLFVPDIDNMDILIDGPVDRLIDLSNNLFVILCDVVLDIDNDERFFLQGISS